VSPLASHLTPGDGYGPIWTVSCADCGHVLRRARAQQVAERTAGARCPICGTQQPRRR
jgi:hypothetical protein